MMPVSTFTIHEVNALASNDFIQIFGNVVEHYPAAAIGIIRNRPFGNADEISNAISANLDLINTAEKEKILFLHPDLVDDKSLTTESNQEQQNAGLHSLTAAQKSKLQELNQKYKEKFGFPFVLCIKDNNINSILSALEHRLQNDKTDEITNGIEEVKKISSLRIRHIIHDY